MYGHAIERILFLDDDSARAHKFFKVYPGAVWVKTVSECLEMLKEPWDEVWLGHDLDGRSFVDSAENNCGMEVVRFVMRNRPGYLSNTRFVIHSKNQIAAPMMAEAFTTAGYKCETIRFFGTGTAQDY